MRFEHFTEIDSTSAELARRARAGDLSPVWIQAGKQTAGKGRRGRAWESQKGNLFCSGLFPIEDGDLEAAARLSYAAALAVAQTCDAFIPPDLIAIKWPNDILVSGAKAAGILLESGTGPAGEWLCVGIGLNLLNAPQDTPYPVTSLSAHMDVDDPEKIPTAMGALAILADCFESWRTIYSKEGFAPIREAWLARAAGLGQPITARLMSGDVRGTFIGLSKKGELKVQETGGAVTYISSGEVFF